MRDGNGETTIQQVLKSSRFGLPSSVLERLALLHRLIECGVDLSGALISAGLLCNLEYMQVLAEIGKANPSESRSNGDAPLHLLAADARADQLETSGYS